MQTVESVEAVEAVETAELQAAPPLGEAFSRLAELEAENHRLNERVSSLFAQTKRLDAQVFDLMTVSHAGKIFASTPDPTRLGEVLLSIVRERMGVERVALMLANDTFDLFELACVAGLDPRLKGRVRYVRREGLFWQLVAQGEPFSVVDVEGNLRFSRIFDETGLADLASTHWIPLKTKDQVVGILTLEAAAAPQNELTFLSLLAAQAAVSIETANLYRKIGESTRELDRQMHHLSILYDIGQALNFIDDLTKLLALILDQCIDLVAAQKGSLMLVDGKTDELVVRVVRGIDKVVEQKILSGEIQCTRIRRGEGVAGRVLESGEPIVIDELAEDGRFKESKESRVQNILCVPLKVYEESIGVINITNKKHGQKFSEEDIKIITALAGQAAVAINNARLYEMAVTDSLTKLFIRRHLQQRLEEELRRARRYGHSVAVCMMDLDHFKQLNDGHGHPAGDAVLVEFARVMRKCARSTDLLARFGGEEFCAVLPETDLAGGQRFAERLVREVGEHAVPYEDKELRITVSVGVASFPEHGDTVDKLIRVADKALYRAKSAGRNRVATAANL